MRKFLQYIPNRKKAQSGCTNRKKIVLVLFIISGSLSHRHLQIDKLINNADAAASIASTLQRFSRGQVLYLRHCADCHGWEGGGDGPLTAVLTAKPRNLRQQTELLRQNTDAQIAARILYGTPLMIIRSEALPYSEAEMTALATYLQQLPTRNWTEIERGKGVYDSLCAACHGLYGRGDGLGARSLSARIPDLTDQTYLQQSTERTVIASITNGKGTMPGAGDVLTAHEIYSVVVFLRILSRGHELYSRFCAHCHGIDGVPVTALAAKAPDSTSRKVPPRLDAAYFRNHTVDQIHTAVQHMGREPRPAMPHLARQLTADETFAIVRYLRTLSSPMTQEDRAQ